MLGNTRFYKVVENPIMENLCRSELTASQRSGHVKRRKVIWEALHPAPKMSPMFAAVFGQALADAAVVCNENGEPIEQVGEVCPPVAKHGRPQEQGFAASTAAVTGEAKRTINQHLARASAGFRMVSSGLILCCVSVRTSLRTFVLRTATSMRTSLRTSLRSSALYIGVLVRT